MEGSQCSLPPNLAPPETELVPPAIHPSLRSLGVPVYLDHAAGGPVDPEVFEAMRPWLTTRFGNPSGAHQAARRARAWQSTTPATPIAAFAGVGPGEVVFTSGGTEADNLAVIGAAQLRDGALVISAVEHPAVVKAASATGRDAPSGASRRVGRRRPRPTASPSRPRRVGRVLAARQPRDGNHPALRASWPRWSAGGRLAPSCTPTLSRPRRGSIWRAEARPRIS